MDFNYNIAHCIKSAQSWGHDSFYNICKGTKEIVPWGSLDWTMTVLGVSVFSAVVAAGTGAALYVLSVMYQEWKLERELNKAPF